MKKNKDAQIHKHWIRIRVRRHWIRAKIRARSWVWIIVIKYIDGCFWMSAYWLWASQKIISYFTDFNQHKHIISYFNDFTQHKNIISYFADFKQNSQSGCLWLPPVQHLRNLWGAMPHHWSPGTFHPPFTASATDLRKRFYSQAFFTLRSILLFSRLL